MFKSIKIIFSALFISITLFSCDGLNLQDLNPALTESQVAAGLKEALNVGTDTAVTKGSLTNGYFSNPFIKIPFPEEANVVMSVVNALPGGSVLVDAFVKKLNSAAEDAAVKATPIFKNAILSITINDAFNILNGADTAATNYLRVKTFTDLYTAFKPDIQESLESVGAQQAWEDVIDLYNSIPFTDPVDTDLANYTTNKGLDGLFYLVGEEEGKIRNDVSHQVTDILQEVFGK
ncbi:MAG: DUF4197 domain-containing protein [Bacteroidetes bacterium]|nr:DUF4197 domain-containing protein [Bacteroidota bacterium]MBP9704400.1 DUF4197 domain-containing protein [Chitinophagales bacterium]